MINPEEAYECIKRLEEENATQQNTIAKLREQLTAKVQDESSSVSAELERYKIEIDALRTAYAETRDNAEYWRKRFHEKPEASDMDGDLLRRIESLESDVDTLWILVWANQYKGEKKC